MFRPGGSTGRRGLMPSGRLLQRIARRVSLYRRIDWGFTRFPQCQPTRATPLAMLLRADLGIDRAGSLRQPLTTGRRISLRHQIDLKSGRLLISRLLHLPFGDWKMRRPWPRCA